jgi:hypothetical protein
MTPGPEEVAASVPVTNGMAAPDIPPLFTLNHLFIVAGYNPYDDSYTNTIESTPADLTL